MREPPPLKVAVPMGAAAGAAIGLIAASLYLGWAMRLDPDAFDMLLLVRLGSIERTVYAAEVLHAWLAVAGLAALGAALATAALWQRRLTTYGDAHWQSRAEMKRNGLIGPLGRGFVCAKLGEPGSKAAYVTAVDRPHVMVVAPTRAGKGVGFVIPNLLSFEGSALVLDLKGELYRDTARWRARGDRRVHRFAPFDFKNPGVRFNPLARIAELETPEERFKEIAKLATLFLDGARGENKVFSAAGRDIFIAGCLLALARKEPRLSAVHALILDGHDKKKQYRKYASAAADAKDETARRLWTEAASTSEKLLTSSIRALMSDGFDAWHNPAVRRATDASDVDFATFRRTPQTLYLCVGEDDIKALAPLLRMIFGDLIATLRHREPGAGEPHLVMLMLDEFQQMGPMSDIEQAMHNIASYGGRIAIVAQSLAALDGLYGGARRASFEAGAALKLYMQPRDSLTVSEVSRAVGSCTRESVTRSYGVWRGIGGVRGQSVREEERPLLSETDARTMDPDDVVVLASPLMPIRARRIKYYEDPVFQAMMKEQEAMEWPAAPTAKPAQDAPAAGEAAAVEAAATDAPPEGEAKSAGGEASAPAAEPPVAAQGPIQQSAAPVAEENPAPQPEPEAGRAEPATETESRESRLSDKDRAQLEALMGNILDLRAAVEELRKAQAGRRAGGRAEAAVTDDGRPAVAEPAIDDASIKVPPRLAMRLPSPGKAASDGRQSSLDL